MRDCGLWRGAVACLAAGLLAGCIAGARSTPGFRAETPDAAPAPASAWEEMTAAALKQSGAELVGMVPSDIGAYCPGYVRAGADERRGFWSGVVGAVWHEGRGAAAAGCGAGAGEAGAMACMVSQMSHAVTSDGAMFGGGPDGWLGLARSWLPFRRADVRAEVKAWGESQSYCR